MTGRIFLFWGVSVGKPGGILTEGASRLGPVRMNVPRRFEPDDVVIMWAPYRETFRSAIHRQVRAAGGRAILVENGWLSPIRQQKYYQIALDGWNGSGRGVEGDGSRWASWGQPLADWRRGGETILVIEQRRRGTNLDPRAMPPGWAQSVQPATRRRIVRRTRATRAPLADQIDAAFATLTWSSSTTIKSLIRGVPAFYCGPQIIGAELMKPGLDVDQPIYPDREPVLQRLAWLQWNAEEIRSGEPFARLLELPHDGQPVTIEDPAPVPEAWTAKGRVRALFSRSSDRHAAIRLVRRILD